MIFSIHVLWIELLIAILDKKNFNFYFNLRKYKILAVNLDIKLEKNND